MNGLKGLIRSALRFYAECNNERYVKMLRKKGISVGEDVVFRNPHSRFTHTIGRVSCFLIFIMIS